MAAALIQMGQVVVAAVATGAVFRAQPILEAVVVEGRKEPLLVAVAAPASSSSAHLKQPF